MNKAQKVYILLAVASLFAVFFLPLAVLIPQVIPYLSDPSNPDISLFYLAEGFVFFALTFLALALMQNDRRRGVPVSPIIVFLAGAVVIYAGYAKLLCDLNETNFFVYLAGIMLCVLGLFEKLKKGSHTFH